MDAQAVIERLNLKPLPEEGGYFRRYYTTAETAGMARDCTPRPAGTAIHYMVTPQAFSALHRLFTPEVWIYQLGDPLEMLLLHPKGESERKVLGPDLLQGHELQYTCPADTWQGAALLDPAKGLGWSLVSCVMVPGYDWGEFELGDRDELSTRYPAEKAHIERLTPGFESVEELVKR